MEGDDKMDFFASCRLHALTCFSISSTALNPVSHVLHMVALGLLRILAFAHLRMLSQPCPSVLTLGDMLAAAIQYFATPCIFCMGWPDRGHIDPECMETR